MPDRDYEYRAQLESHFQRIDQLLERLQKSLTIRWVIVVIGLLVAGYFSWHATRSANNAIHRNSVLVHEVATERREAILQNCIAQNQRHDNTIAILNQTVAQYEQTHPNSKNSRQLRTSVRQNVALINALAPKQNCQALANHQAPIPPAK